MHILHYFRTGFGLLDKHRRFVGFADCSGILAKVHFFWNWSPTPSCETPRDRAWNHLSVNVLPKSIYRKKRSLQDSWFNRHLENQTHHKSPVLYTRNANLWTQRHNPQRTNSILHAQAALSPAPAATGKPSSCIRVRQRALPALLSADRTMKYFSQKPEPSYANRSTHSTKVNLTET